MFFLLNCLWSRLQVMREKFVVSIADYALLRCDSPNSKKCPKQNTQLITLAKYWSFVSTPHNLNLRPNYPDPSDKSLANPLKDGIIVSNSSVQLSTRPLLTLRAKLRESRLENLRFAFTAIAPLFTLIMFGYLLRRKHVINQEFIDTASRFTFSYLFPLTLFRQIYQIDITQNFNIVFILYGVVMIIIMGFLLLLIAPRFIKNKQTLGAYIQASFKSNCVLMGVALSISVFGEAGAMPTIMLLPFASITLNIVSVLVLTMYSPDNPKLDLKSFSLRLITNPIILGPIFGIIVSLIGIRFPVFLENVIDDLAAMTTPLALILLGGQLALRSLFESPKLLATGVINKLVLSPILAIVPAVLFFNFTPYEMGAIFFIFGSSTAVNSFVMAKAMKSDARIAGQLLMASTIFSGVTMFIWVYILKSLAII